MATTKSGTLSADDRKGAAKAPTAKTLAKDGAELGPGLVEHGVGLGRHRVEDGPVPAEGTVILVTPERGVE